MFDTGIALLSGSCLPRLELLEKMFPFQTNAFPVLKLLNPFSPIPCSSVKNSVSFWKFGGETCSVHEGEFANMHNHSYVLQFVLCEKHLLNIQTFVIH